jgi:formate-dependent nitrite reductase membrane component NrfD
MSFREKTAWLALAAMALAYGAYFVAIELNQPYDARSMLLFLGLFAAASVLRLVIEFGGRLVLVRQAPEDARAPADERDRAIARRSASVAYWALMIGMINVGIVMPFSEGGWAIVNAALFALVAAELIRYGVMVYGYRRGWHG